VALGANVIAKFLKARGLERVFVYPGGTIAPVLDELHKLGVDLFVTKHEQGAGFAALAAAKLSGEPQVCLVTSGPGVTNAVTPLADAFFDSVPVLFITGQIGTGDLAGSANLRQRGFQEVDTPNLCKPIAKAVFQPSSPDALADTMVAAYDQMLSGRQGPVVIDLPMDVQRSDTKVVAPMTTQKAEPDQPSSSAAQVEVIAQKLAAAERPLIIAGNGVRQSEAMEELRQLAQAQQCAVTQSLPALGVFPTQHPQALGFHGHTGSQAAGHAIQEADFILAVGTRLDVRQTGTELMEFATGAWRARIDIDPTEIDHTRVPCDITILGDAQCELRGLIKALDGKSCPNRSAWLGRISDLKDQHRYRFDGPALKPQAIIAEVSRRAVGDQILVTSGVGSHQQWVARHFDFDLPKRNWFTSAGHGTMGYDLPAAIGLQLAEPEASVFCFVGDGSLQMNIQELATVVEHDLPIKIFLMDNARLAIVSQFQLFNWEVDLTTGDKKNPDFAAIAKAYGLTSFKLDSKDQLEDTVAAALAVKGPCLVHCKVDPMEDVSPMLLAGQKIDEMWHKDQNQ